MPPMWRDVASPSGLKEASAYDGTPPVRSGIMAASSARQKHSSTPAAATPNMIGTAAAPSPTTSAGASPVTRMTPARPMTNAPHQLVPRCRLTELVTSATMPPLRLAWSALAHEGDLCRRISTSGLRHCYMPINDASGPAQETRPRTAAMRTLGPTVGERSAGGRTWPRGRGSGRNYAEVVTDDPVL